MHALTMSVQDNLNVKSVDSKYSSGDSKNLTSKKYQEENNNEVDELSKELSEMGCVVGVTKRAPNICVETCVYESDDESEEHYDEDGYSDEFEEDKSEEENDDISKVESEKFTTDELAALSKMGAKTPLKLSSSQFTIASNKPPPSVSGRSTSYGSISVPPTRRVNMSFTNERMREIERHNHILLGKILSARNTKKSSIPPKDQPTKKPVPSAAVFRKNEQRKIDHDNMILLKKIQRAKSSSYSFRR